MNCSTLSPYCLGPSFEADHLSQSSCTRAICASSPLLIAIAMSLPRSKNTSARSITARAYCVEKASLFFRHNLTVASFNPCFRAASLMLSPQATHSQIASALASSNVLGLPFACAISSQPLRRIMQRFVFLQRNPLFQQRRNLEYQCIPIIGIKPSINISKQRALHCNPQPDSEQSEDKDWVEERLCLSKPSSSRSLRNVLRRLAIFGSLRSRIPSRVPASALAYWTRVTL
jgi:hypothetical protein